LKKWIIGLNYNRRDIITKIGKLIKKKRKDKKLSISKLSFLSGITKKEIFKIELGCLKHPFLNTLLKLSEHIELNKKEIIECDVIYNYDFEVMKRQCETMLDDLEEMQREE